MGTTTELMQIKKIKRPWNPNDNYGHRLHKDPFYNSSTWKNTKAAFKIVSSDLPDGKKVSNSLCYDCFIKGHITPMHSVDHMIAIEDGGSRTDFNNLRSLCLSCHNTKSAIEGNERRKIKVDKG